MSRNSGSMPWDTLEGLSTRSPRILETRELTARPFTYVPPSNLPDPLPRDGYAFRWIRKSARNEEDRVHFNKRSREGYVPVMASEYPELMVELGLEAQNGIVEVGGLVLCKIDAERVRARERYYSGRNLQEMEAADSAYMRDNDQRMAKVVERKSTFGRHI